MNNVSQKNQAPEKVRKNEVSPKHPARKNREYYSKEKEKQQEKAYYSSLSFIEKWKYNYRKITRLEKDPDRFNAVLCLCGVIRVLCGYLVSLAINLVIYLVSYHIDSSTAYFVISTLIFGIILDVLMKPKNGGTNYKTLSFSEKLKAKYHEGRESDIAFAVRDLVIFLCAIIYASSKSLWHLICIIRWYLVCLALFVVIPLLISHPIFTIGVLTIIIDTMVSFVDNKRKSAENRANKLQKEKNHARDNGVQRSQPRTLRIPN